MARLIPISEMARDHNLDLGETYDLDGRAASAMNGDKVGTVINVIDPLDGKPDRC
ncbi:hypothetical protein GO986_00365 [Deinococcus sp. HMF7620]|uniref:Uncharacterized protein n=1 Tax=Deinococcus arboris TaxID=2682977 RepID=A0A7C9M5N2_9DEIO|nr:hypothetical protein [Deinococcus arboris]MVN85223.1 hypothetical protein [Deinococcus arboris]